MSEDKKIIVETNFKENLSNPLKRLVFLYPIFIVSLVIAGKYFVQNLDYMSDNNSSYKQIIVAEKQDDDIQTKPAMMLAGVDVKMYIKSTDELINKGSASFATNCASCHGEKGMGDGAAGAGLNPKPRNFHSQEGWTNGSKIGEMYKTLEEGIIKNGMNSYSQLPVDERLALIYYIRSLATGYPDVAEADLSDLDLTYSLSAGKQSNNQIPVAKASTIIYNENKNFAQRYNDLAISIENSKGTDNYNLFKRVVCNEKKLFKVLDNSLNWKENINNFTKLINSNIVQNGAKTEFTKLNSNELVTLHSFIKSIM